MNGTEARLYVSWKHDELDFYMANVKSFLLQEPERYIEFRKCVRNIIDWGRDKRLNQIRNSLDILLEKSRKRTSEAARTAGHGAAEVNGCHTSSAYIFQDTRGKTMATTYRSGTCGAESDRKEGAGA